MNNCIEMLPRILEHYDLHVVSHEHLRTSENAVIKLLSDDGRACALRIRKIIGTYQEQIMSELIVLRDFSESTGADIPAPLATRSGELFCIVNDDGNDFMCIIFSWVGGVHLGGHEITPLHMTSMARAVAQLHRFSSSYHPPEKLFRPVYDDAWFFGDKSWTASREFVSRLDPDDAAYLCAANDSIRERLRQYPNNAETFGLIHYDLHVGNFLFNGDKANMIDFDECGFGWYLFDLAHILFEFIGDQRFDSFKKVAAENYGAGRVCPAYSDSDLNLFLALQGIAYMNWLHRIFWRDGNTDAQKYWVPVIVGRLKSLWKDRG